MTEFFNIVDVTPTNEFEKILSLYNQLSLELIDLVINEIVSWKESEPEQSTIYWDKSLLLDERLQVCSLFI